MQAPGALNWNRSAELRAALIEAAAKIRVPVLCAVAENDATTESARSICAAAQAAGARTTLKVYPPFTGGKERPGNPPGHALFGPLGLAVWQKDALDFLASVTRAPAQAAPVAPPDQFFDSNGVRIRYVEQGSGPAIVLMHGMTGTLDRHFIANGVFANLAQRLSRHRDRPARSRQERQAARPQGLRRRDGARRRAPARSPEDSSARTSPDIRSAR